MAELPLGAALENVGLGVGGAVIAGAGRWQGFRALRWGGKRTLVQSWGPAAGLWR